MKQEEILQLLSVLSINFPEVEMITVTGYGSGDSWDDFYEYDVEPTSARSEDIEKHADLQAILEEALEKSGVNCNNEGGRLTVIVNLKDKQVTLDWYANITEEVWDGGSELIDKPEIEEDAENN